MLASELRNQIDKMIEKYGDLRITDDDGYEMGLGISFRSGDISSMRNIEGERVIRQDYFIMFGQCAEFCDGFSKEIRLYDE